MSDHDAIGRTIEAEAEAVGGGDRAGILAGHADDLLMLDFPGDETLIRPEAEKLDV